jgi:hypothetical protein
MKKVATIIVIIISLNRSFSQTKIYTHCNCTEKISESGYYTLTCSDVIMEEGQLSEGNRDGQWTTRNIKGTIIIKASYKNDNFDGKYEQFHFDGKPKLTAQFAEGAPQGDWRYYNDKGKVIKSGTYNNEGIPEGNWKIFDKKGKKVANEYDFLNSKAVVTVPDARYFKNNGVVRDDESGEWMIIFFPERNIKSTVIPFGGYLLSGDLFIDFLNIPFMFMNTYTQYDFIVRLNVNGGKATVANIFLKDKNARYSSSQPSLPFIVQTNSPGKLSRTDFSNTSLLILKNRIKDAIAISGPWISNGYEGSIEIQIPFVLNEIRR